MRGWNPAQFMSRVRDPNCEPSFGDYVAEEITVLCREEYSTHERDNAGVKRELAELQAQIAGLRLRLTADTIPKRVRSGENNLPW